MLRRWEVVLVWSDGTVDPVWRVTKLTRRSATRLAADLQGVASVFGWMLVARRRVAR